MMSSISHAGGTGLCLAVVLSMLAGPASAGQGGGVSEAWQKRVTSLSWTTYAPPSADPDRGIQATAETIRNDLALLRRAGFDGIITYGGTRSFVESLVDASKANGVGGLVLGVWDPENEAELAAAEAAGANDLVVGYCIGNEGYQRRYDRLTLLKAMERLRKSTGKPVTTSEELDDYLDPELVAIGDWVFPNAHPFFHSRFEPEAAVRWTWGAYDELSRRSRRFVWFKEVGLPTAGNGALPLSEVLQDKYYAQLAETPTVFAYFEAFDQPWKSPGTVEQHWGLFRADGTPKTVAKRLIDDGVPPYRTGERSGATTSGEANDEPVTRPPYYVYADADSANNHFSPTLFDGDCGDIRIDTDCDERPKSGKSCVRISYRPEGTGPNRCHYAPPCKWASLAWQHPAGNDGKRVEFEGKGINLDGYRRLTFWARAESPCRIRFFVGGTDAPFGDSLTYPRHALIELTATWRKHVIDLAGADLGHLITGFGVAANWDVNPETTSFYVDEIRFE